MADCTTGQIRCLFEGPVGRTRIFGERNYRRAESWPEEAPFDAILVTAAAEEVPEDLVEQLKVGGIMVIPVDKSWYGQELIKITKNQDGSINQQHLLGVRFVPLLEGTVPN